MFGRITLPPIAPGVVFAAALFSMNDCAITSFIVGLTQTFSLVVFGATRQGGPTEINVFATMLLVAIVVLLGLKVMVQRTLAARDARKAD